MALFHAKKNGDLLPIAIQLFQTLSEENPVGFAEAGVLHVVRSRVSVIDTSLQLIVLT